MSIERNDSFSSNQTSPSARNSTPTFVLTAPGGSDSGNYSPSFTTEENIRTQPNRSSRKSKHIPDIESLPEGQPLDITQRSSMPVKTKPLPINLKHDSSDAELHDLLSSRESSVPTESKTLSMPNSPMKSFEFFMELGEKFNQ